MEQIRITCETDNELESVLKTFERMGVTWSTGHKATSLSWATPCAIYWTMRNYLLHSPINSGFRGYRDMTSAEFLKKFGTKKTIVVYQKDASTVVAVEKSGRKVLKSEKAKCSPEDVFNFDIGAQLALGRLFGKQPPHRRIIKQDNYRPGDKVLIKTWDEMKREYGIDGDGDIGCDRYFTKSMKKYCETVMTIKYLTSFGNYHMWDVGHIWSHDMIRGKVVEE